MATERRQNKVSAFIKQEIAITIKELSDPRIGFITILSVDITPDLKIAKIYYSVLGSDANKRTTQRALDQAKGYLRRQVGKALQIKFVPEIQFFCKEDSDFGDNEVTEDTA
ncbi:MAG: ribosome-binding factor A [Planctomycetota bacterium]|nr:MAG: ribosome-binding factor A [Planctomycetota bacterium]